MTYRNQASDIASLGRFGDTEIMHINPIELDYISRHVPLTVNPDTGKPEAFLPLLLGLGGSYLGGAGMLGGLSAGAAGALGAGLGSFAESGDLGKGIMSGLMGYGLGTLGESMNLFGGGAGKALNAITPEASASVAPLGEMAALGPTAAPAAAAAPVAAQATQAMPPLNEMAAMAETAPAGWSPPQPSGGFNLGGVTDWAKSNPMIAAMTAGGLASQFTKEPKIPGKKQYKYNPMRMERESYSPSPSQTGVEQTYFSPATFTPLADGGVIRTPVEQVSSDADRQIVVNAIAALKKQHPNPEVAIEAFLRRYGSQAFEELMEMVKSGELDDNVNRVGNEGGIVSGIGDGQSDMIPASIEDEQEAQLSDGEFVLPSDVVSGIGNGSTDAGARRLYDMMGRVRAERNGTPEKPRPIDAQRVMPR